MPEIQQDKTIFTLLEVTKSIQKVLNERYQSTFWVKAEMNKLNYYKHSGHCYPELVEKVDGKIIAQIRSQLWKADYIRSDQKFRAVLNEPLKDGIKILFLAKISFDSVYGLSLNILDIDPGYTLGDLEREKKETIQQLKEQGVFDWNKQKVLPLLPKRIAIISVESSKGYADFMRVLQDNPFGYRFFSMLFPSLLQGDKAIAAIVAQLKRIKRVLHHFDAVAIIRGGGGDVGLSCYNHYQLASAIARFPIPVITGIGHATNETVAEMVSFANAITPTKIAEYLIQKFHNFAVPVREAERKIGEWSKSLLREEKNKFYSEIKFFRSLTESVLLQNAGEIRNLSTSLLQQSDFRFKNERLSLQYLSRDIRRTSLSRNTQSQLQLKQYAGSLAQLSNHTLQGYKLRQLQLQERLKLHGVQVLKIAQSEVMNVERNVHHLNPMDVLKRGYSLTRINGKIIDKIEGVHPGDKVETLLADGTLISIAESIQKNI